MRRRKRVSLSIASAAVVATAIAAIPGPRSLVSSSTARLLDAVLPVPPAPVLPPPPEKPEIPIGDALATAKAEYAHQDAVWTWEQNRVIVEAPWRAQLAARTVSIDRYAEAVWFAVVAMFASAAAVAVLVAVPGRGRAGSDTRCGRCGHILKGLTQPRCPECGHSFASAAMAAGADSTMTRTRAPMVRRAAVAVTIFGVAAGAAAHALGRPVFIDDASRHVGGAVGWVAERVLPRPDDPTPPPAPIPPAGAFESVAAVARAEADHAAATEQWHADWSAYDAIRTKIGAHQVRVRRIEYRAIRLVRDAWIVAVAVTASVLTIALFALLPRRGSLDGRTRCGPCGSVLAGLCDLHCPTCGDSLGAAAACDNLPPQPS